jgi:chaperone BCS1
MRRSRSTNRAKLGAEITKALTTAQQSNDKNNKNNQGISLSGLLNGIDGVASHEGRVLVMTSNFPEKLDDALIRPGRIDMRIDFTKATRSQMSELFTRMYSPDTPAQPTKLTTASATSIPAPTTDVHCIKEKLLQPLTNGHLPTPELTPPESPREATTPSSTTEKTPGFTTPASELTATQLRDIATAFAAKLEEDTFTPAKIQGFLLTRKKEPVRALSEVHAWKVSLLEAREKKKAAVMEKEKGA